MNQKALEFERNQELHRSRKSSGVLNALTPLRWRVHHDDRVNRESVARVEGLAHLFESPTIVAIGAGGGGLLRLTWKEPHIRRIGFDVNHAVLMQEGKHWFEAVEANAFALPLRDSCADIVLFDYVLHHLVGQDLLEDSIHEAMRVLRKGGYLVAREPSSFSPGGIAMNIANRFRLMNLISGASIYEFALSPRRLIRLFQMEGSMVDVHGLSYFCERRMPIWAQDTVNGLGGAVSRAKRGPWFADFVLYVARKNSALAI